MPSRMLGSGLIYGVYSFIADWQDVTIGRLFWCLVLAVAGAVLILSSAFRLR